MENMTALISCFIRAYHTKNSNIKIYEDNFSNKLLYDEEYKSISKSMIEGISFFNPNYNGDNPLKWIINNQIGPSVLARAIFNEKHLLNEIKLGLKQYVVLGSGYDTSAYKINNKIKVFELDKERIIKDKIKRIKFSNINNTNVNYVSCDFNNEWIDSLLFSGFKCNEKTFCSIMGISYYLDKSVFKNMLKIISDNTVSGSVIIFDCPNYMETEKEVINQKLARGAHEKMKSKYSYDDIENIASESNLLIYEYLSYKDIEEQFFYDYNTLNPDNKIIASKGINYYLLVKY